MGFDFLRYSVNSYCIHTCSPEAYDYRLVALNRKVFGELLASLVWDVGSVSFTVGRRTNVEFAIKMAYSARY